MESTTDTLEVEKRIFAAYRTRIAELVLPDKGGLDQRDAMILIDCGVLAGESDDAARESNGPRCPVFTEVVEGHAMGPLVFYKGDAGDPRVARARDLLLDDRVEIRRGAMTHLQATASSGETMSEYTSQKIAQHREAILSEDRWRRPAIELADALDDDWLFNLAGVLQARTLQSEELWHTLVSCVMRPTMSTVQKCLPRIVCYGLHQDEIENRRVQLLAAEHPIDRFCDKYIESFGHLQFSGEFGLGKMLEQHEALPSGPVAVDQILEWATRAGTPIARYHACEAILATESQLTPEQRDVVSRWFWEAIVPSMALDQPSETHAEWELMGLLARYYVHYMEVRLPSDRSELISAMAWWMASRVTAMWSAADLAARSFSEQLSQRVAATASSIWYLIHPPMQPCMLRWLTMFGPSPWAASLLSSVTDESQMKWLVAGAGPGTADDRIIALTSTATLTANLPLKMSVYRYSPELRRTLCWALAADPDDAKRSQLMKLAEGIDWEQPDSVSQALDALERHEPATQSFICNGVRQQLSNAKLDGDAIWALVSGSDWKSTTWLAIDLIAAQAIILALVDDAARRRPEWAPHLPHLLAEVSESRSGSEEERAALFGLLLRACCALNAPSGLVRLMRGHHGRHFRTLAAIVKGNVEQILPQAGGWGAGRLRALLVDLP